MVIGVLTAGSFFIALSAWSIDGILDIVDDAPLQTFVCVCYGPVIGYAIGAWAGRKIILDRWHALATSLLTGLLSVAATTVLFSSVSFFGEGVGSGSMAHAAIAYILRPLGVILLFGTLPILICACGMALWLRRVRRRMMGGPN